MPWRMRMCPCWLVAVLVVGAVLAWPATATAEAPPLVVIGLRPARGKLDGPTDNRRLREAGQLRTIVEDAVRDVTHRSTLDEGAIRKALGKRYGAAFLRCRGRAACVARAAAKLKKRAPRAVYGDYVLARKRYRVRLRLIDLGSSKVVKQVELALAANERDDAGAWARELAPLLATEVVAEPTATPDDEPTADAPAPAPAEAPAPVEPAPPIPAPATPTPPTPTPPVAEDPPATAEAAPTSGVPELPPLSTVDAAPGTGEPTALGEADDGFIDSTVLDAIDRGITWHGHFHNLTAVGVRGAFRGDVLMFEDRLQLEFESDLKQVRVIGKPQLVYDLLDDDATFAFRELYVRRELETFEISLGEHLVTWGVTDFWPIVDIISPRDYRQIRNWRPIDEKLPVPMLQATWQRGPVSLQVLGLPLLRRSRFVVDQTRPFAIPVPAPTGTTVEQADPEPTLWTAGGGARLEVTAAGWKLALYGLVGRDPLPSVHAQIDLPDPTRFIVDNERVAMAAASVQGSLLGTIVRAEAAGYHRLDDACEGQDDIVFGVPECFYLRRVPTARANVALERRVLPGLDAHLQLISEITRAEDVPELPAATEIIAPGLPAQYPWNRIVTLRLQGDYLKSDFRPMVFGYLSLEDEAFFVNGDLEYHVADGFALAVGVFWFRGFADDPNKNKYTLAGALERSSHAYVRATAWF